MIFSAIADGLLWIIKKKGTSWAIHYIDDFLNVGAPHSDECLQNTLIMQSVCEHAGLPMEPSKSVGPDTSLVFLGIEIDSVRGELRLPLEKLSHLQDQITQWKGRKACRKRELLSLIGSLSHACKVVRAGRTFLRRLIDLSTKAARLDHFIRLNEEARADIEWWYHFIVRGMGCLCSQPYQRNPQPPLSSQMRRGTGFVARYGDHIGFSKNGMKERNLTTYLLKN